MKNFKKVISTVVAFAMALSSFAAVNASSFTDVADTAAYAEAIDVLSALGIVNGYVDDTTGEVTFKPEGEITRAEAATMIVGALNMTEEAKASAGTSQFDDVNTEASWASGYVNVGVAQGFINGMDANTFAPMENVTYAQMCVMLTSIAGFGEYAAANTANSSDWSYGYTSMAAATGINKGVSVSKDTALTRGQVAMMIYNTLLTPKLGVAEYSLTGNTYSQLDGRNGRDFVTLLSEKFDGYVVTAQIMETSASAGTLENDEVKIHVQKADWWNEQIVTAPLVTTAGAAYTEVINVEADVEVNNNLLQIGKAVIVYDELDDPWMVYFSANAKTETREFDAADYVEQAKLGASNTYGGKAATTSPAAAAIPGSGKIRFGSKYYTMATVTTGTGSSAVTSGSVALYVNGAYLTTLTGVPADNAVLDKYLNEAQGTIKLVKQASDNGYSSIFVDAYEIAEVTNVSYKNNQTVVNFIRKTDLATSNINKITINDDDVEDGDKIVSVFNGDAEIALKDLQKDDIIAIACDFGTNGVNGRDVVAKSIKVLVSRETVNGQITGKSVEDKTYTVGDKTYDVVGTYPTWALRDTYTLTLDPFGRIFEAEQDVSSKSYAVVEKWNNDAETVQLVLADGTVKSYELESGASIKDENGNVTTLTGTASNLLYGVDLDNDGLIEADNNANITPVPSPYVAGANETILKKAPWNRVVEYVVKNSTGTISEMQVVAPSSQPGAEYKAGTQKLAGGTIQPSTNIIDAVEYVKASTTASGTNYANGRATDYASFAVDSLKDGSSYDVHTFKPAGSTYVSFVIMEKIGNVYAEESRFAVVRGSANQETTDDGDIVYGMNVLYDGAETKVQFETNPGSALAVGDAFYFEKDSEGLIDSFVQVFDYSAMSFASQGQIASLASAFTGAAGLGSGKYDSTTPDGWSFGTIYDDGHAIQLFPAIISNVSGNTVELAKVNAAGEIDRNHTIAADITAETRNFGIETFGLASDAHVYVYDRNDTNSYREQDKIFAGSLTASVLDPFEITVANFGSSTTEKLDVYKTGAANAAGDYADDILNFALVMAVDGDIVCAYEIAQQ